MDHAYDGQLEELSPRAEQILDAAIDCFAHAGFHGTRTVDIARAAGVGEGTIYNHFKDKLTLFVCVIERIVNQIRAIREAAFKEKDSAIERLLESTRRSEAYMCAHREHAEILTRALMIPEVTLACKRFLDEQIKHNRETFEGIAFECGLDLNDDHRDALVWAIMGGYHMLLTNWATSNYAREVPGIFDFTKSFIEILQLRGRKAGEPA